MGIKEALFSIGVMIFLYLFGSRDDAFEKDFLYFDPPWAIRFILYLWHIPATSKISFSSLAMQILMLFTMVFQLLSLMGIGLLEPILQVEWFGKYTFTHPESPYFQTVFCVIGIFFPVALLIIIYFLFCILFAPPKGSFLKEQNPNDC